MMIRKRDGSLQQFERKKIETAITKAFQAVQREAEPSFLQAVSARLKSRCAESSDSIEVEMLQDMVEEELMKHQFYAPAKAYILYRQKHTEQRLLLSALAKEVGCDELLSLLKQIRKKFPAETYDFQALLTKLRSFLKEGMSKEERLQLLIKASAELISKEAPDWEYIAARFLSWKLHQEIKERMRQLSISTYYEKILYFTKEGLYGGYLLEQYTKAEIEELSSYLKDEQDQLLTYSGLELLMKRYLVRTHAHEILETPQEMFLGIAMHLAMKEKQRVFWAKEFYDMLSSLKVTMATPTMSNARKPYHQLSSCFIDTVEDSLSGIYKSLDNFAQVSKFGGGMGMYFGKVRAAGSDIRGFAGAAGGVIRWLRLVNDTATAVDQLGVRQGAVAVYLDAWHRDLPEFLNLRTNNGDERMKAHDIFPAVCYPDLFWRKAKENLEATWYLMCPHEIQKVKGYALEDHYGEEWEKRYWECVEDVRITKREVVLKDLIRLILKSAVETGTPFAFYRDHVNRGNPNAHSGMIYCSNLCTEIAQNMSAIQLQEAEIKEIGGETIIVQQSRPGDFVVCNLASLSLGRIAVNDRNELRRIVSVAVRALDNVIDLNYYPLPYAQITNHHYRPIGLGVSGYHHMLTKNGIRFESEEHLRFVDALFEDINRYAIEASCALAKEKGAYALFQGSDWDSGAYFVKRGYESEQWQQLRRQVHKHGLRNGWLMAVAPTSSTSIIAGTSAGIDPIMNKYFLEEKKGSMIARVAPELNPKSFWLYKSAHQIDQEWILRAAGIRQRHIDQAQSLNLYITNSFTLRGVLKLYLQAWELGIKTIYYVRSKSLEVEECESCAA